MSGRTLTTTVSINGSIDASVQKAFAHMADNLSKMQKTAVLASGATDKLSAVIDLQSDELESAKKAYTDYILSGEKSRKKTKELEGNIKKLAAELNGNEKSLKKAQDAAEKLAGGLKKTGDAANDAEDGFTVMRGAAANLVANGITALTSACVNAAKTIAGLAESTREYREDMSKLKTSFETLGHTAQQGTDVYKELFSVFGEEDRAVEAAQQIAALSKNQGEMTRMVDIATGAWARWGDSLATESLMEAMNSTAKIGSVQGTLADALEWSGVNLDQFNASLASMSSEEERSAHIMNTLEKLYGKAADDYRENNANIIEARKASSDYTDTIAKMGEIIEPITTKVQQGFTLILQKVLDLVSNGDVEAFGQKIDAAFGDFVDNTLPKIISAMEWIANNTGLLTGIAIAIGVVSAAIGIMNTAMAIQNAIMLASPTTWIVLGIIAAIAALIAIIVLCINYWDNIKAAAQAAVQWIVGVWSTVSTWFNENVIQPIVGFFTGLWNSIIGIFQSVIDWVTTNWQSLVLLIINPFAGVFSYLYNNFEGFRVFVDNFIQRIRDGFSNLVNNIKSFFASGFESLVGLIKKPINAVVSIVNGAIDGINKVGFDIPEWVPVVGGKKFSVNIPKLPTFATGGFTDGVSIAGEKAMEAIISFDPQYRDENIGYWLKAGQLLGVDVATLLKQASEQGENGLALDLSNLPMYEAGGFTNGVSVAGEKAVEAVISFDPAYRTENLAYWAQAGRMLGADTADYSLGNTSNTSNIDLGGVTFAPNITVTGKADKESIMEAIEAEYPEFLDMLEEYFMQRSVTVYA